MQNTYTADTHALERRVRKVDGVFDIAVGEIIIELARGHDGGLLLALGRTGAQMRQRNDILHADDLLIGKVRDILADAAGGDSGEHGVVIHDLGARLVDDAHAVFHLGKRLGIEHVERLIRIRHVDTDIVRLGIDAVEVHLVLDIARETPCRVHGQVRVVTADIHAEVHGGIGDERTDGA